jgi:hypothetical protein
VIVSVERFGEFGQPRDANRGTRRGYFTGLALGLYAQCALPSLTEVTVAVPLNFSPSGKVVRHVIEAPFLAAKSCGQVTLYVPPPKRSVSCFDAVCSMFALATMERRTSVLPLAVQATSAAALASDVSPRNSRLALLDMR